MSMNIQSADDLVGKTVMNSDGEELGELHRLMVDAEDGWIAYAVLSFGGLMGFGDKLFAVPFPALEFDTEADRFILEVDKERLEDAPQFDESDWPRADEQFLDDVHVFYGVDPYWRRREHPESVRSPSHPAAVPSS